MTVHRLHLIKTYLWLKCDINKMCCFATWQRYFTFILLFVKFNLLPDSYCIYHHLRTTDPLAFDILNSQQQWLSMIMTNTKFQLWFAPLLHQIVYKFTNLQKQPTDLFLKISCSELLAGSITSSILKFSSWLKMFFLLSIFLLSSNYHKNRSIFLVENTLRTHVIS